MSNQVFKITNKANDTLEIDIEGVIGCDEYDWTTGEWKTGNTKESVKSLIKEVANSAASNIVVNINSYGGVVNDGVSIHDMLAEHKAKVTTIIHGHTASAATIISQAGNTRKMSANALFLIHPASTIAAGNTNDMKLAISDLEKIDNTIAGIYAKRTGKTVDEIMGIMNRMDGRGEWLTAAEAKELGFIDEIIEPMKAVASAEPNILNRFKLPGIPQDKINYDNMKADKKTVFAWFEELIDKVIKTKPTNNEPEEQDEQVKPDEPVTEEEKPAETENVVKEIVIKDIKEVREVLNDFVTQIAERDTEISNLQSEITKLKNDLDKATGLPTLTEPKDDPLLDPGKAQSNLAAAEKNAQALKEGIN
jgi:ATP-dependent Clp endopeptidase proteolytic subunit ClpP